MSVPRMMAQILVNKFVSHLPEYRQVKMYGDLGFKLLRTTLWWLGARGSHAAGPAFRVSAAAGAAERLSPG